MKINKPARCRLSSQPDTKISELQEDGGQKPSIDVTCELLVNHVWAMGDCQGGEEHLHPLTLIGRALM
jgi:hypothetical protein